MHQIVCGTPWPVSLLSTCVVFASKIVLLVIFVFNVYSPVAFHFFLPCANAIVCYPSGYDAQRVHGDETAASERQRASSGGRRGNSSKDQHEAQREVEGPSIPRAPQGLHAKQAGSGPLGGDQGADRSGGKGAMERSCLPRKGERCCGVLVMRIEEGSRCSGDGRRRKGGNGRVSLLEVLMWHFALFE